MHQNIRKKHERSQKSYFNWKRSKNQLRNTQLPQAQHHSSWTPGKTSMRYCKGERISSDSVIIIFWSLELTMDKFQFEVTIRHFTLIHN